MGLAACAGAGLTVCARENAAVRRASVRIHILRSINVEKDTQGCNRMTHTIGDCFPPTVTALGPDYVGCITHPVHMLIISESCAIIKSRVMPARLTPALLLLLRLGLFAGTEIPGRDFSGNWILDLAAKQHTGPSHRPRRHSDDRSARYRHPLHGSRRGPGPSVSMERRVSIS
jgi:hypothetical protein